MNLGRYSKFVVALTGAAVTVLTQLLGGDSAWVTLVTSLGTAFGVYQVPNKP